MSESFLSDGLIFEDVLPVLWTPGPLAEGLTLARLNADNHQLLGAEASLDEVRVHEALKDESPALVHELQRLEYKVNILLRLTAELAMRSSGLPPAQRVRLTSRAHGKGLGTEPFQGARSQPHAVKIPCSVVGELSQDNLHVAQMRFHGLTDAVIEQLDKLIFRHHRRLVAGAKLASH